MIRQSVYNLFKYRYFCIVNVISRYWCIVVGHNNNNNNNNNNIYYLYCAFSIKYSNIFYKIFQKILTDDRFDDGVDDVR